MFTLPPMKNSDQVSRDLTASLHEIKVTEKHDLMTLLCNPKNLECRKFYKTNGQFFHEINYKKKVKKRIVDFKRFRKHIDQLQFRS